MFRPMFICMLITVMTGMALYSCQTDDVILARKNMQFVGQFKKGFSYEVLGFGPLLRELTFNREELIALAVAEIPEVATLEEIHVVDVGFRVTPNATHEAELIDIRITEDTSLTTSVFTIEDLFVDGQLIIDPSLLNLGEDYEQMMQDLNQLFQSGSLDTYVLNLILGPGEGAGKTDLEIGVVFSFTFSFRACVDVPAGTVARECGE